MLPLRAAPLVEEAGSSRSQAIYRSIVSSPVTRLWRWLSTYEGLTRWPTTPEAWLDAARDIQTRLRAAAIEVAADIGAQDLAERMRLEPAEIFPAADYLVELNKRQPGAANRAHRLARRMRDHKRLRAAK